MNTQDTEFSGGTVFFIIIFLFVFGLIITSVLTMVYDTGHVAGRTDGILSGAVMHYRDELVVVKLEDGSFVVIDNTNNIKLSKPIIRK